MLRVAAAKVNITPAPGAKVPLKGYDPKRFIADPETDIFNDLHARMLLISDGVREALILSIDCCMANEQTGRVVNERGELGVYREFQPTFPEGTRRRWAESAGLAADCVAVYATHTHSAPDRFAEQAVADITAAIEGLRAKLQPAILRVGSGTGAIAANRRPRLYPNYEIPVDQTLHVLSFTNERGEPLAALVNYAVHPTICFPRNKISSECVGIAMEQWEEDAGNHFVALFTQSFSGDVGPIYPGMGSVADTSVNMQFAANRLHYDIKRALSDAEAWPVGRIDAMQKQVKLPTRAGFEKPDMDLTLTGLSLGDLALVSASAEVFNGYTAKILARSPFAKTILGSLANGYSGYIPTVEAFRDGMGGYEWNTTPFDERVDPLFVGEVAGFLLELNHSGKQKR